MTLLQLIHAFAQHQPHRSRGDIHHVNDDLRRLDRIAHLLTVLGDVISVQAHTHGRIRGLYQDQMEGFI